MGSVKPMGDSVIQVKEETAKICRHCRWYDMSRQRDFHRKVGKRNEKGERTEIVKVQAICRNKKVPAGGHLVKDTSQRECFKEGVYKSKKDTDEKKTSPEEYFGTPPEIEKLETMSAEKAKAREGKEE